MRFVVVFDACVLYPAPLRDFLMRLAVTQLFAAKWSEAIHDEWSRNLLAERPELEAAVQRTRRLMNLAVPDCIVEGYEDIADGLRLPDPNDRHVLAAAICAGAQTIVTFNLKDFPSDALEPYGIEAIDPDTFVLQQADLHEGAVVAVARDHRASLVHPPKDVDAYLVPFNESSPASRRPSRRLAALRLLAIGCAMSRRRALPATPMPRRENSTNFR